MAVLHRFSLVSSPSASDTHFCIIVPNASVVSSFRFASNSASDITRPPKALSMAAFWAAFTKLSFSLLVRSVLFIIPSAFSNATCPNLFNCAVSRKRWSISSCISLALSGKSEITPCLQISALSGGLQYACVVTPAWHAIHSAVRALQHTLSSRSTQILASQLFLQKASMVISVWHERQIG